MFFFQKKNIPRSINIGTRKVLYTPVILLETHQNGIAAKVKAKRKTPNSQMFSDQQIKKLGFQKKIAMNPNKKIFSVTRMEQLFIL